MSKKGCDGLVGLLKSCCEESITRSRRRLAAPSTIVLQNNARRTFLLNLSAGISHVHGKGVLHTLLSGAHDEVPSRVRQPFFKILKNISQALVAIPCWEGYRLVSSTLETVESWSPHILPPSVPVSVSVCCEVSSLRIERTFLRDNDERIFTRGFLANDIRPEYPAEEDHWYLAPFMLPEYWIVGGAQASLLHLLADAGEEPTSAVAHCLFDLSRENNIEDLLRSARLQLQEE